jgi:hypothetical protein
VGSACQRLCRHALCPDWLAGAALPLHPCLKGAVSTAPHMCSSAPPRHFAAPPPSAALPAAALLPPTVAHTVSSPCAGRQTRSEPSTAALLPFRLLATSAAPRCLLLQRRWSSRAASLRCRVIVPCGRPGHEPVLWPWAARALCSWAVSGASPCGSNCFQFLIKSNRLQTFKIHAKFHLSQKSVKQILVGRFYSVLVIKNMKHMYFMEITVVIYLILIILVNSLGIHIKFCRTPKIIKFCS